MVIDSTDRERLGVIKEELFKMLAHEVRPAPIIITSLRRLLPPTPSHLVSPIVCPYLGSAIVTCPGFCEQTRSAGMLSMARLLSVR